MEFDLKNFTADLNDKLNAFDKEGVNKLCDDLTAYLYHSPDKFPEKEGEKILGNLRNKRMFALMNKVGDALIQTGSESHKISRQYAQSLIDQSNLTGALAILRNIIAETNTEERENIEANGLIGRVYKQLYINANNPENPKNIEFLKRSINSYLDVYNESPKEIWHGINAVALLQRAEKDGINISDFKDSKIIAKSILNEIEDRESDKKADTWDFATAVEACIALNLPDEALKWLAKYVEAPYVDAFELASTLRQFEEVWKLNMDSEIGEQILPILKAKLLDQEGGQITLNIKELKQQKKDDDANSIKYEKVFGAESFRTYKWYMIGADRCKAIARIGTDSEKGFGTGFLLKGSDFNEKLGDELVLLTNAHVISNDPNERGVLRPDDVVVIFEILNELQGSKEEFRVSEIIWNSPKEKLDATLLRFRPEDLIRLKEFTKSITFFPVSKHLPIVEDNQRVYVIGHPSGGTLQLSFVDNMLLDHEDPRIHYRTPTTGGSSGSPVFNEKWDLIGLHHAGSENMPKLHGEGTYKANEGMWIQSVIRKVNESEG